MAAPNSRHFRLHFFNPAVAGQVDLSGHGDIASAGSAQLDVALDLQGHGDAASAGRAELVITADLTGHGDAASAGTANLVITADLNGHGDASTTGQLELLANMALAGHGDVSTTGSATLEGTGAPVVATEPDSYTGRNHVLIIVVTFRYPYRRRDHYELVSKRHTYCPQRLINLAEVRMAHQTRVTPTAEMRAHVLSEADRLRDDLDALTLAFELFGAHKETSHA